MRPSLRHARRVRAAIAALAVAGATTVVVFALTGGLHANVQHPRQVPTGPTPWDFTVPAWDSALGGDAALTPASYAALTGYVDPHLGAERNAVRALAGQVATADLTATGREPLEALTPPGVAPYWPAPPETAAPAVAECTNTALLAISPAALPVTGSDGSTLGLFTSYSKTLVAFTGTCGSDVYTTTSPGVRYVYAGHGASGWVPLRSWQVPSVTAQAVVGATSPYDWELEQFTGPCAPNFVVRDRIAVVDAFTQMCTAARSAGVDLKITAGYRTPAEQADVFQQAVAAYGSTQNARKYVAYADKDTCTSKHCSGLAVTLEPSATALTWLTKTVGCVDANGTVTQTSTCPTGATPVPNLARWGFAQPLASSPGYLEFVLPLTADKSSSLAAANCAPVGLPVANQVAAIFRCRLAREGVVGPAQDHVVAEALTISRCESGWNATAAAFGGKFAVTANPVTGRTYTQQGVFMISGALADAGWVSGGRTALADPVANINAAASLWLATRGWEQFGCATGDVGGFEAGPVLPAYGGPKLPAWAAAY